MELSNGELVVRSKFAKRSCVEVQAAVVKKFGNGSDLEVLSNGVEICNGGIG